MPDTDMCDSYDPMRFVIAKDVKTARRYALSRYGTTDDVALGGGLLPVIEATRRAYAEGGNE